MFVCVCGDGHEPVIEKGKVSLSPPSAAELDDDDYVEEKASVAEPLQQGQEVLQCRINTYIYIGLNFNQISKESCVGVWDRCLP